jgi:hypothetical protein
VTRVKARLWTFWAMEYNCAVAHKVDTMLGIQS